MFQTLDSAVWGRGGCVPFDGQIFRLRFAPLKMTTREAELFGTFEIR